MPIELTRNRLIRTAMPGLRSLPPSVGDVEIQKTRILNRLRNKATDLDKYEVRLFCCRSKLFSESLLIIRNTSRSTSSACKLQIRTYSTVL